MPETNKTRESVLNEYRKCLPEFLASWRTGEMSREVFKRAVEFHKEIESLGISKDERISVEADEFQKLFNRPWVSRTYVGGSGF
jgi:hypothetical protein